MGNIDAQENLKPGDAMGLWGGKSEQADQISPAQRKTSLESSGGHARQQQQQRGQPSFAEGDQERQLEPRRFVLYKSGLSWTITVLHTLIS